MRLLLVSPYLPHRAIGHGGGTSTYRMAIAMARRHEVTLLCPQRSNEGPAELADLGSHGVRVVGVPFRSAADRGAARALLVADRLLCWVRAWVRRRPYFVERYDRAALRRRLEELLFETRPHAIQVEYQFMAPYARHAVTVLERERALWPAPADGPAAAPPRRPRVALNTHEAGALPRMRRVAAARNALSRWRALRALRSWSAYEARCVRWPDVVWCVTEQDRALLRTMSGRDDLIVLPLGVDTVTLPVARARFERPPRLLFVGSFDHAPNREAALLLAQQFLPALRALRPDVQLDVVGRPPPAALLAAAEAAQGSLRVHGFVDDLQPLFDDAWLFVAPLFSGGGIKIKVIEALGRGVPVLTTPIGLEGIDAEAGVEVEVASTPEALVARAASLLQDPAHLRALARAGRAVVERRYSWDAILAQLERHL